MVQMSMGNDNRQGLVCQLANLSGNVADAGAAVNQQRTCIAFQQIHIYQLIFTDKPGTGRDLNNRSLQHSLLPP